MEEDPKYQAGLCGAFLGGYVQHDKNGLPRTKYFTEGSEEEWEARETLAFLLRSQEPLNRNLRDILAALFDPAPAPMAHSASVRKLRFAFRGKGQNRDHRANTMIAWHVWEAARAGNTVTGGITSAADRFHKDESTVKKLWGKYRLLFEAVWGKLR